MNCKHKLFLNKNKKKKQMVSFYILWNFSWIQAYVPFIPAGVRHANDPLSVLLRKILEPHPRPILHAKLYRNESKERNCQILFLKWVLEDLLLHILPRKIIKSKASTTPSLTYYYHNALCYIYFCSINLYWWSITLVLCDSMGRIRVLQLRTWVWIPTQK